MSFMHQLKSGQKFCINKIPSELKTEFIRLGLCEGDELKCVSKIPDGPVVILKDLVQLAIGKNLAEKIEVTVS